jgi:hypothetical protein
MAKSTKDKPPFVEVEWEDAWKDAVGDTTLANAHEEHKPIICFSHGYVIQDNDDGVQLANEYSPNGTYRHRAFIPRKMIKNVTLWKWTKVKAPKSPSHAPPVIEQP